jgi:predicted chitinase
MLDQKAFFDAVRHLLFSGHMVTGQVAGCTAILAEFKRRELPDLRWLAYMLATAFHETGTTMQPVIETRQAREVFNPSVDTAIARLERAWAAGKMPWVKKPYWRKDAEGLSWLGRGLPQVTHKANYTWAENETGIPFTINPDLMLIMENAVPVMFIGMIEGRFTGKKLSDYFNATKDDPKNARRIINALESADKVADYYAKFNEALKGASA